MDHSRYFSYFAILIRNQGFSSFQQCIVCIDYTVTLNHEFYVNEGKTTNIYLLTFASSSVASQRFYFIFGGR